MTEIYLKTVIGDLLLPISINLSGNVTCGAPDENMDSMSVAKTKFHPLTLISVSITSQRTQTLLVMSIAYIYFFSSFLI